MPQEIPEFGNPSEFIEHMGVSLQATTAVSDVNVMSTSMASHNVAAHPFSLVSQPPFQDITARWASIQQFRTPSQFDFGAHVGAHQTSKSRSSTSEIDEQDSQGRTQLHQAVIHNSMDQVRALLSSGAHVDIRDLYNNEPLHLAVGQNEVNQEIVKILLDYGARPDSPGEGQKSPLHLSVKAVLILQILLKAGPKLSTADLRGNTALHDAALCDDGKSPSCFIELLTYGADVNVLNAAGQTPFHLILNRAAQPEWTKTVVIALKHGADAILCNERNQSPLQIWAQSLLSRFHPQWLPEIELFCTKGANLDVPLKSGGNLSHSLIQVVEFGRYGGLAQGRFICERAHPLIHGLKGNTVFHELIGRHSMEDSQLIEILLDRGADPNAESDGGVTPFYLLFSHAFYKWDSCILKVIEMFINAGANPIHSVRGGDTPFYAAVRELRPSLRREASKALLVGFVKKCETTELSQTLKGLDWWHNYIASLKQAENGDWVGADNRLQQGNHLKLPMDVDEDIIHISARIVLAENTLRRHKAAILVNPEDRTYSEQELGVFRSNVVATLRGCRANRILIDPTFYQLLLDVIDFGG